MLRWWSAFSYLPIRFVFYMATSTLVISPLPNSTGMNKQLTMVVLSEAQAFTTQVPWGKCLSNFTIQNIIKTLENCWIYWILLANTCFQCFQPKMITEISWLKNQNLLRYSWEGDILLLGKGEEMQTYFLTFLVLVGTKKIRPNRSSMWQKYDLNLRLSGYAHHYPLNAIYTSLQAHAWKCMARQAYLSQVTVAK